MYNFKIFLDTKLRITYLMTPVFFRNMKLIEEKALSLGALVKHSSEVNFQDKKSLAEFNLFLAELILSEKN